MVAFSFLKLHPRRLERKLFGKIIMARPPETMTQTPYPRRDVSNHDTDTISQERRLSCKLEVMTVPSIFSVIRKAAAFGIISPTFALSCKKNAARRKWNKPLVNCAS